MSGGFPLVALGEVLTQDVEYIDQVEPRLYPKISVKWWGKGAVADTPTDGSSVKMSRHQLAKPGQVIVSEIWAKHGSIGIVPPECAGALVTSHFFLFKIDGSQLLPRYMHYLIEGNFLTKIFGAAARGSTGYAAIRPRQFLAAQVPLPPLAEQRRIVARIEEVAGKIEAARGLRRGAVAETQALVLAGANRLIEQELWAAVALGDVADIRAGVTLGRKLNGHTVQIPYLRVANVQDGHLDLQIVKYVEVLPDEVEKWRLQPGDLLMTEGGDWDKLGRGALWSGEITNCIHQNHVFRVRTNPDQFFPRFLSMLTSSSYAKSYFQSASKRTTNLASINQKQLRAFTVFLPPLAEQRRIVAHLDVVQEKVDALKRLQAETAAELDALLPSVLDRAFSGGL